MIQKTDSHESSGLFDEISKVCAQGAKRLARKMPQAELLYLRAALQNSIATMTMLKLRKRG